MNGKKKRTLRDVRATLRPKYGISSTFNPEGSGYDYDTARKYGLKPDETGHWPSREPRTGKILKGRKHKTWHKTVKGEDDAGYKIIKRNGQYFSVKI
jgi:hypothetical protein